MLIKSVPPVLAPPRRHREIAKPATTPPNTLFSSGSVARVMVGSRSVRMPVRITLLMDSTAKRFPIKRKQSAAAMMFMVMLRTE